MLRDAAASGEPEDLIEPLNGEANISSKFICSVSVVLSYWLFLLLVFQWLSG